MKKVRKIEKKKTAGKRIKRCWIHVGMHKTGTSSIQANLSRVEDPEDWCYLKVGNSANMGGALQAMFGNKPENFYLYARRGETAEQIAKKRELMRRQLELIIRRSKAANLILSAENLSIMNKEEISSLRDFLAPLVDEIRVIAYVRPHGAFRMSWFQQLVKNGKSDFDIDKVKPHYRKRFSKFDGVFGAKKVKLRLFDPSTLADGCIVADFCGQIGITPPDRDRITRVNESLTREACGMLYAYYKFGPGYGVGKTVFTENGQLIAPMFAMKGAKFRLADSLLAPGRESDADDIAWMEKRLKSSLDEPWKSDGTEVASEGELLKVGRDACAAYLEKFRGIHGIEVADEILPPGDFPEPQQVADMLEHCRQLLRRRMKETAAQRKSRAAEMRGGRPYKRCWIHIGMHKTGTASIQENLGRAKHPVGWRFLKLDNGVNMGKSLYAMFGNNPQDFHLYAKRGDTPEQLAGKRESLRRQFEQMILDSKEDTLILSSETLSVMDKSEIEALRDFLAPLVDDVRVIAYVRSAPGFRNSWFQQTVKHGRGDFEIGNIRPQYRKRFRKFDEIFGVQNVKLCLFSPAALTKGCIVTDFCGQIGIAPPDPGSIIRVNQGFTKEACGILYAYRKYGSGFGTGGTVLAENKRIIQPLLEMSGTKFRLADSLLSTGSAGHAKDIAWMETRLGISLAEEWQADGTEITCEDDLLRIPRSACVEFLGMMHEIHGIEVSENLIPADDPQDPVKVAELVGHCRNLIRESMKRQCGIEPKTIERAAAKRQKSGTHSKNEPGNGDKRSVRKP